ncbi:MAG: hypothetical protein HY951_12860 [Bacteroidia bacterium]|nr:hypothetical protein [Bacteroidia bacterium]
MKKIILLLTYICLSGHLFSQSAEKEVNRTGALKLFIECNDCDLAFIKKEVLYVNYVRDPKDAQVHVLVSSQSTGSSGQEYKLFFTGQKELIGMIDTIIFSTNANNTTFEIRNDFLHNLQLGLLRYVAKTKLAKNISIKYESIADTTEVKDKWDSWVFTLGSSAWLNAEQLYNSASINSNLQINRVTEKWKYDIYIGHNYYKQRFEMSDTTIYSTSKSLYSSALIVKSITNHWSAGLTVGSNYSTYSNIKLGYFVYPALEYNIFPYTESSRKQFTIRYTIGYKHYDYLDTTIYNKINEKLYTQSLNITLNTIQKWGNISISINGQNYFHDFTKNSLNTYIDSKIRIVKGLSFNIYGSYSFIRNQLSLPKSGATQEEMLLRQKELATSFSYYFSIGLSYTFGSIYNNVVNPRFGG